MTALLDRLEELEARATERPWMVDPTGDIGSWHIGTHYEPIANIESDYAETDAELICKTRNAIPLIIAEIRRLEAAARGALAAMRQSAMKRTTAEAELREALAAHERAMEAGA